MASALPLGRTNPAAAAGPRHALVAVPKEASPEVKIVVTELL
jgi:hypothetical protein